MSQIEVDLIIKQLCQSIDVIMSDTSDISHRNVCNQMIEDFKCNQNILIVLKVSIKLLNELQLDANKAIIYKHFALQLLEFVIKYNWNSIETCLKNDIKLLIEKWFDSNDSNHLIINGSRHLMNASSRCVIEVLMREWPQNWPQFMNELMKKQSLLSLFVIWQLAEDIGIFFLPNNVQRRREITNEFINNINQIYSYISDCLLSNDLSLCQTSLSTLNVLLEWTPIDSNLLNILIQILTNDCNDSKSVPLKQSICDCLIVCLNRKKPKLRPNDRTALQILFGDLNINRLLNSVGYFIELSYEELEKSIELIKRLIELLCEIGQQLVSDSSLTLISTHYWTRFTQLMILLFSQQNLLFNAISVQFWFSYVKNKNNSTCNQAFDKCLIISLLSIIPMKLSRQDSNKHKLGFEFDNIEDFESVCIKFRSDNIDLLRQLSVLDENLCYNFVSESLNTALSQSNNNLNDWEILAIISAAIYNKISNTEQFTANSDRLIQSLLNYKNTNDPNVISSQLSCISALTVFLPHVSSVLLNELIKKVFTLASYTMTGQTKSNRTMEVKNLRRHACSFFIKICQTYPSLLLPLFSDLKSHIDLVTSDVEQFSQMEKCTLYEGLMLISNEFDDIESQTKFVIEVIEPINWFLNYNITTDEFINQIGLNNSVTESETFGQNRANILYVVNLILGLFKRVKTNRKTALIPHLFPYIRSLFPVICNLNSIWRPEYQEKCHQSYRSFVFSDITENDRINVLDIAINPINNENNTIDKSESYKMQVFIWTLHEICFNILGMSTNSLKPQFYDEVFDFISILNDIPYLPVWKLRMIVKLFVRPLIANCPNSQTYFTNVLQPIISTLLPFLFNKINHKWDEIKARNQYFEEEVMKDDCQPLEAELISDQLNRLLSREFVELLTCILNSSKDNDTSLLPIDENNPIKCSETSDSNNNISELGNYLITTIPDVIILSVSKCLSWLDTTLCLKTSQLNLNILQKLLNDGLIKTEDGINFLFEQIITALSYFGEHEQNQAILLQLMLILYEGTIIKLRFNTITQKLSQITGTDITDWNQLNERLFNSKFYLTEKKKKDFMRQLLLNVIGKNMGQLYRYRRVEIKNLKPIFYSKKYENHNNDEDISLCLLFNNTQ